MTAKHKMRLAAQRFGIDLTRWPQQSVEYGLFRAFVSADPDVILDVGANRGQFVNECRRFGYCDDIISFEPGREAYEVLARTSGNDRNWRVERLAVGAASTTGILNVAANAGASSSLLRMLDTHVRAAPHAPVVSQESVDVVRLDSYLQDTPYIRIGLKVDVQGAERLVLDGAEGILDRIVGIRLECSTVHLYEGDWLWDDAASWMQERSFLLAGLAPGFSTPDTGRLLQFDAVFVKPPLNA